MVNATNFEALTELRGISKYYGIGENRIVALQNINLGIYPSEFVAILGPSGCGKSTLVRIITGLAAPSEGEVLYRGKPLLDVNPHATIVFQTFALYPWLTVLANVEVALKARGVHHPSEVKKKALAAIDMVGLDGFEEAYPRELSGGMRQKVGFARAIAVQPGLLCLDEPFSSLDILSADSLRGELMELWLNKAIPTQAILMITHNIEEAVFMADRIIIMAKDPGRIIGEIKITLAHPRHRKDLHFLATTDRVYAAVAGETGTGVALVGTAPGEPGKTHMLPRASIEAVAGFIEHLHEEGGRADLYRLGDYLGLEIDDFLPIVNAAELFEFARVVKGDIILTVLGQTFAEASILARKEIFQQRIKRLPMIRWIVETLQESEEKRVPEEKFLETLEQDFTPEMAKEQLDTAIDWGRYAELFAFNDNSDELFLEIPV